MRRGSSRGSAARGRAMRSRVERFREHGFALGQLAQALGQRAGPRVVGDGQGFGRFLFGEQEADVVLVEAGGVGEEGEIVRASCWSEARAASKRGQRRAIGGLCFGGA